jgi:hypothetical protein
MGGRMSMKIKRIAAVIICMVIICLPHAATQAMSGPSVVYNPERQEFLCIDMDEWDKKITGYTVNARGMLNRYEIEANGFEVHSSDNWLYESSLALDTVNNQYLAIWSEEDAEQESTVVKGRFISGGGEPGDYITVYENVYGNNIYKTSMAFDEWSEKYLVVWQEEDSSLNTYIMAQMLDREGNPEGDCFKVKDVEPEYNPRQYSPMVTATGSGKFLVVWVEGWYSEEQEDIYYDGVIGKIVDAENPANDESYPFTVGGYDCVDWETRPHAAYDSVNNRFLVVWDTVVEEEDAGYYGRRAAMQLIKYDDYYDTYFGVFDGYAYVSEHEYYEYVENGLYQYSPAVAYDSFNERFLAVWEQEGDEVYDGNMISGKFLSFDSNGYLETEFSGDSFRISGYYAWYDETPSLAYYPDHANFLAVYTAFGGDESRSVGMRRAAPFIDSEVTFIENGFCEFISEYDNILKCNTSAMEDYSGIWLNLEGNGNELVSVYGEFLYNELWPNEHYRVASYFDALERDWNPYNKYMAYEYINLDAGLLAEYEPGEYETFTFEFDMGSSDRLTVCFIDSSGDDTEAPEVLERYEGPLVEGTRNIVFSEAIHEYYKEQIKEAVLSVVPEDYGYGNIGVYWDSDSVLTVYCYGDETEWLDSLEVEVMDYAGNINTVVTIDPYAIN